MYFRIFFFLVYKNSFYCHMCVCIIALLALRHIGFNICFYIPYTTPEDILHRMLETRSIGPVGRTLIVSYRYILLLNTKRNQQVRCTFCIVGICFVLVSVTEAMVSQFSRMFSLYTTLLFSYQCFIS